MWSLEQYLYALGVRDDTKKIENTTLYLEDTTMIWWIWSYGDIERVTCIIDTCEEFKRELKKQFYLENTEGDARAKLRFRSKDVLPRILLQQFPLPSP